jgi:hypothetical protein
MIERISSLRSQTKRGTANWISDPAKGYDENTTTHDEKQPSNDATNEPAFYVTAKNDPTPNAGSYEKIATKPTIVRLKNTIAIDQLKIRKIDTNRSEFSDEANSAINNG